MPFIAVLCLVLLLIAALGQSLWWRGPEGSLWHGLAAFYWGIFFLAVFPSMLLLLLVLILLFGGIGYRNWGYSGGGIGLGTVLVILLICYLLGFRL